MKYEVKRGIEKDDAWRFEPGDTVKASDIKGAPIEAWIASGVLEEVDDGDG